MFVNNIDPILFSVGGLEVRYYGLVYIIGFLLAYYILIKAVEKNKINLTKNDIYDLIFYLILGVIIGARLFEVIFYHPAYYINNPLQIFAIWRGGLSFHGGLIGSVLVGFWFCNKKKIRFYELADILVLPLAFALFLGRLANFTNHELVGRITNVSWAVKFRGYEKFRHPSQIYEALKNLFIFFILFNLRNKKFKSGTIFWLFLLMYSFLRFFIEFFRQPDTLYLGIPLGQLLSFVSFFIALFMLYKINKK